MCPLRVLLIFLSATLAGFFVLRSLKTRPEEEEVFPQDHHPNQDESDTVDHSNKFQQQQQESLPCSAKIRSAIGSGFWTCVDMASGRYLWRNLVSSSSSSPSCASKKKC